MRIGKGQGKKQSSQSDEANEPVKEYKRGGENAPAPPKRRLLDNSGSISEALGNRIMVS